MERVSRQVRDPNVKLAAIRTVREFREFESNYKEPSGDPPTINTKDWSKTMEAIEEHFRCFVIHSWLVLQPC
jgi:hypothetical protein